MGRNPTLRADSTHSKKTVLTLYMWAKSAQEAPRSHRKAGQVRPGGTQELPKTLRQLGPNQATIRLRLWLETGRRRQRARAAQERPGVAREQAKAVQERSHRDLAAVSPRSHRGLTTISSRSHRGLTAVLGALGAVLGRFWGGLGWSWGLWLERV